MTRVLVIFAITLSVGCHRVRMREVLPSQSGAMCLVEQSEPSPGLLASELNDTKCEPIFLVRNQGQSEINVTIASKSCACIELIAGGKSLKAGDSFLLFSGEQKSMQLIGRVDSRASVQRFSANLSASDGSSVNLEGSQTVYSDLTCEPNLVTAPMRRGVHDVEAWVEIIHSFRRPLAQSMSPRVSVPPGVEVVSISTKGEPEEIEPGLLRQKWKANLKVTPGKITDGPAAVQFAFDKSSVGVPVKVTKAFGITLPEKIVFGALSVGAQRKRRLVMYSIDGVPFKVVSASTDSPEVAVSVAESNAPNRYWINLDFHPTEAGERRAGVSINTTHPDSPNVTIETVGRAL